MGGLMLEAYDNREYLADCISRITPEDCPDNELRMTASEAAAAHIQERIAEFRGPQMPIRMASAARDFRNKWYAERA